MSTSTCNIGTNGPAVRSHDPSDGRCAAGKRETDEAAAALTIQRHYRGYATRKQLKGMHMGSEARWNELMKHTEERTVAEEQLDNKNDVKSRWRRGVKAAARLQAGDAIHPTSTLAHPTSSSSSSDADVRGNAEAGPSRSNRPILDKKTKKSRRARFWGKLTMPAGRERDESEELPFQSKALEQQHWLEMIDGKHRYGSNLKYYFREWKEADTKDNFFRWLDRGEGKNLDLEELPRDRLEKERITYLSAEQRLNYLVRIDEEGLIRWVHNDELVDTAAGKWQDSGDGTGIVPDESYTGPNAPDKRLYASPHADKALRPPHSHSGGDESDTSSVSSDSYGAGSELQENEATHYDEFAERDGQKGWMERKFKEITPGGMKKELLRKTLRGNTWIYASDMKMNLFVGIKQSGTFQHSSFIAGGKVTSAGIIVVKRGVIKKLNPWSGHYRSTIAHYRAFIAQLEDKGADLSHVKVGKSVMQMWGLGKYTAITKGQKGLIDDVKRKLHLKHEPNEMEKSEALKKKVEEGERKAKEKKEGGQEGQNGSPEVR